LPCRLRTTAAALALLLPVFGSAPAQADSASDQSAATIEGIVQTRDGRKVEGATVRLVRFDGGSGPTLTTDPEGAFRFSGVAPGDYEIQVEFDRLTTHRERVQFGGSPLTLRIRLSPLPLSESITITATRSEQRLGEVPAHVSVVSREDLQDSPALALDDALRHTPSFSLFRRTSSLVAHPTTAGVTLRGVGASGASRTLVLADGLPHNDPFGNWVYWNKVPLTQIESVEVVEGALSDQYGHSAMAGVIHLTTRRPRETALDIQGRAGGLGTADVDSFASRRFGRLGIALGGRAFTTDGYHLVAAERRGAVDEHARSRHETLNWEVEYKVSEQLAAFHRGRFFAEARENGTALQENSTRETLFAGGLRGTGGSGDWQVNAATRRQTFESSFSAIAPDRSSETLSLLQSVPSRDFLANGLGRWTLGGRHRLAAGAETHWVGAKNLEDVFSPAGANVRDRDIRGEQWSAGVFIHEMVAPAPRLVLTLGGRLDTWRNFDATRAETVMATGETTLTHFLRTSQTAVSPRAGLLYRLSHSFAVRGAYYQGFRAPSLNELYRPFRVGNVQTLENEALRAERLTGAEAGFNHAPTRDFFWRVTTFWNRVKDPISNLTLSVTPALITRQRQNLGRLDVRGFEGEAEFRPGSRWSAQTAYLFNQSVVREFPAAREIEGLFVPQVPRHRASLRMQFFPTYLTRLSLQARYESHRFDDDLNQLRLGWFWVADFAAFQPLGGRWEAFFAAENLFNRRYAVQATPVELLATPRIVMGGLRFRLSAR
jgi:outer membrane receptor protein involved in Fe transport